MRLLLRTLVLSISALLTLSALPAWSASPYVPDPARPIHPGVQVVTPFTVCTSNYVFTDVTGSTYVGYTSHCNPNEDDQTSTNGCLMNPAPIGSRAQFVVDKTPATTGTVVGNGTIAYSA